MSGKANGGFPASYLRAVLTGAAEGCPEAAWLQSAAGHGLTEEGRAEEALAFDRRAAELEPADATRRYNLGCTLALTGATEAALDELEEAVELGYSDAEWMEEDDDLAAVRGTARYRKLLARISGSD